MSRYHVWDTPPLFVAALLAILAIGIEAGIAINVYVPPHFSPVAWGLGSAAVVFVLGHARRRGHFAVAHMRLLLLIAGIYFIGAFLIVAAVVLAVLAMWALAVFIGEMM